MGIFIFHIPEMYYLIRNCGGDHIFVKTNDISTITGEKRAQDEVDHDRQAHVVDHDRQAHVAGHVVGHVVSHVVGHVLESPVLGGSEVLVNQPLFPIRGRYIVILYC